MTVLLLLAILLGLLVIGVPTPVALGASGLVALILMDLGGGSAAFGLVSTQVLNGLQSYPLAGIAFFLLYGQLCAKMDVRGRLADAIAAIFRRKPAGTGLGEIVASLFLPDTAAEALTQRNDDAAASVNRLRRSGVAGWSAIGLSGGLAALRLVMPPAVGVLVIAQVLEISTGALFATMLAIALLFALLLLVLFLVSLIGKPEAAPQADAEIRTSWSSLLWIVVLPLILGSILNGVFTPTEAGVFAAFIALILGTLERQLTGRRLLRAVVDTLYDVGAIILVLIFAGVLVGVLNIEGLPVAIARWAGSAGLLLAILAALLVGFLTSALVGPAVALFVATLPAFLIARAVGLAAQNFAVVYLVAVALGLLAPPMGPVFATLAAGTTMPVSTVARGVGWFALAGLAVLIVAFAFL